MLSWRNKKSKLQSETHYTTDSRDERERLVKKASGGSSQLYGIECRWPTTRRVHYEVMHRKYLWPSGKDSTHHAIINSGRKVINGFIKNMLMFQLRRSLFLLSSQMRLRRLATLLFTVQVNFLLSSCLLVFSEKNAKFQLALIIRGGLRGPLGLPWFYYSSSSHRRAKDDWK